MEMRKQHEPITTSYEQYAPLNFIISPVEKENAMLFAELMNRLIDSRDACRDAELIKLADEMTTMCNKLRRAFREDPNVPFPGDISKTISTLEEALSKWDRIPSEIYKTPPVATSGVGLSSTQYRPNVEYQTQGLANPSFSNYQGHSAPPHYLPSAPFPPQAQHFSTFASQPSPMLYNGPAPQQFTHPGITVPMTMPVNPYALSSNPSNTHYPNIAQNGMPVASKDAHLAGTEQHQQSLIDL